MRRLIRLHGPCELAPGKWSPYEALTRAIAHQQLHGRAAESILARFVALFENGRFPSPMDVSAARPARLRRRQLVHPPMDHPVQNTSPIPRISIGPPLPLGPRFKVFALLQGT